MLARTDVTALILAGGRATRLGGVDKRTLQIDGASIFERQCAVLAPLCAEILVSTPGAVPGYRTVADPAPGGGPLAGIAAGLAHATTPWLLVVAGDMPHLSAPVLRLLLGAATGDVDAVGIRIDALPEPLLCLYRVAAVRPRVEARLAAGRLKASALLTDEGLEVAWVEGAELRAIDPDLRALTNINTPADLER